MSKTLKILYIIGIIGAIIVSIICAIDDNLIAFIGWTIAAMWEFVFFFRELTHIARMPVTSVVG